MLITSSMTWSAYAFQGPKVLPSLDSATDIGVTYIPMTDRNRMDPFTNYTRQREVMTSIYYPAEPNTISALLEQETKTEDRHHTTPYMPPKTAALYDELATPLGFPTNTFEQLSSLCQQNAPPRDPSPTSPLLLFSPGGGASRFLYSTFLEDLARRGYTVVAIDHPYDALVVEFSDRHAIIGLNKTLTRTEVEQLVTVRAQDLSFVIDELSHHSSNNQNTTEVIALGHSLGGAAVAEAALSDSRIKGGINLDGRLFGSIEKANTTLAKPFLQFASEASSSDPYLHWDEAWARLTGWKVELVLSGAAHATFTDLPVVAEAFGVRGRDGEDLLGKLGGVRGVEVVVEYVSAFAGFVSAGEKSSLLGRDGDERFPEVSVRRCG